MINRRYTSGRKRIDLYVRSIARKSTAPEKSEDLFDFFTEGYESAKKLIFVFFGASVLINLLYFVSKNILIIVNKDYLASGAVISVFTAFAFMIITIMLNYILNLIFKIAFSKTRAFSDQENRKGFVFVLSFFIAFGFLIYVDFTGLRFKEMQSLLVGKSLIYCENKDLSDFKKTRCELTAKKLASIEKGKLVMIYLDDQNSIWEDQTKEATSQYIIPREFLAYKEMDY